MIRIENREFQIACKEVLEILKNVEEEDLKKIPIEEITMLKENASNNYEFTYNPNKSIKEQNVSKLARAIIAKLFTDYIATERQKKMINAKREYDIQKLEEQKLKRYNPNEIFKNKKYNDVAESAKNLPMEIKKERLIIRIIKILKKFFRI